MTPQEYELIAKAKVAINAVCNGSTIERPENGEPFWKVSHADMLALALSLNGLASIPEPVAGPNALQLPEGFVEFAMEAMGKALALRANGDRLNVAFSNTGRATWIVHGEADYNHDHLVTVAAAAIVLAVEEPTIELKVVPLSERPIGRNEK